MAKYYKHAVNTGKLKCVPRKNGQKAIRKLLAIVKEKYIVTTEKKFEVATFFIKKKYRCQRMKNEFVGDHAWGWYK